jgi:lysophospholipase L1-like esterase
MELFTPVELPETGLKIDYTKKLAFFGSCFADNMSEQFARRKFCTFANPFGTVYNPLSIERMLVNIAEGKFFGENDVFQDLRVGNGGDGLWHSWDAHSSLSAASREECICKLNEAAQQAHEFLQQADMVFITLGSAFVYSLKGSADNTAGNNAGGHVVANCHRQDPRMFDRRLVSVEEAAEAIRGIVERLRQLSPTAHIVFTVSPIRHPGDGAHGNNLSKATVLLAVNQVVTEMQASAAHIEYFPCYEIVMDELRDYRFYESDMIHLSKTAEQIIFERMMECYCDETTRGYIAKVEKFLKMANHRIVDANSPATLEFKKKLAEQAASLEKLIPGLDPLRLASQDDANS